MNAEVRDSRFARVVGSSAECRKLAGGFLFTEGPLWDPRERRLLFSDIPGNEIRSWHAKDGVRSFRKPSHMSNGLAWDREGRLLCCEHASSSVTRTDGEGIVSVVASHYEGKALNSPNDIVVKSDGAIYFTDPSYGRMEYYGVSRPTELDFRGVYRVGAGGGLALLANDFDQPNGLCFSADERRLFVNDTARGHVRVFDVMVDGSLANSRVWVKVSGEGPGAPDGMKIDSEENLYCCGPGGVHVFDRSATCLGVIRTPEGAANFAWGGEDLCDLLITATSSLYGVRVTVPGVRSPFR